MVSNSKVKDVHCLLKSLRSLSGGQATVVDFDSDNIEKLTVQIKPDGGLYKGGSFDFEINLENYPDGSPSVTCITKIYHPNIDVHEDCDNVCLNILDSEWGSELSLDDVIQGLLFLFYEPNLDDPLSTMFEPGMDLDQFEDNVRRSLLGEEVEGEDFHLNLDEDMHIESVVRDLLEDLLTEIMPGKVEQDETNLLDEVEQKETTLSGQVGQEETTLSDAGVQEEIGFSIFVPLSVRVEQEKTTLPGQVEQEDGTLSGRMEAGENSAFRHQLPSEFSNSGEAVSIENKNSNVSQDALLNGEVFPPSFTREHSKSEQKKGIDGEANIMDIFENNASLPADESRHTAALGHSHNSGPQRNMFESDLRRTTCFMDNLIPEVAMIAVLMSHAVRGLFGHFPKES